jgi:hypothetical protein
VPIRIPSDVRSSAGRATHDVALAALLGGNLFGRVAMHPALGEVSDKSERGKVPNRAWRRYGTVNSLALVGLVAGWLPARRGGGAPRSPGGRRLVVAKDIAVGAVVITGLASAAGGVGFARQAPSGAVPMESGHDPAPEAPARAARLKRVVNTLGTLNLIAELALAGLNAVLAQTDVRRRVSRRGLRRR